MDASEYLHYLAVGPSRFGRRLPILISQSGESPEVVRIARWLRDAGAPFVALTNAQEGSLATISRFVLPLHAGRELGPSTKSYVNTMACALLLSESIVGQPVDALAGRMRPLVGAMAASLANPTADRVAPAEVLARARHVDIVARGPALSLALQTALLLREVTGLKTSTTSAGLFRHGPMHTVGPGDVVMAIAPAGATQGKTLALMAELDQRGAETIIIAPPGGAARPSRVRSVDIPDCDELLASIPAIVPIELLAMEVCRRLNRKPGAGVVKVTTGE
jgi:glucosamine--fructose-6-phosphate aminotransferase (isomerizing)